jgi:hypothetical protein
LGEVPAVSARAHCQDVGQCQFSQFFHFVFLVVCSREKIAVSMAFFLVP